MSHDVLCTLQDRTVFGLLVVNGSVVSVLTSDVDMSGTEHSIHGVPWRSGTEHSQHPWSPMEKWCGDLSATTEYHGELGVKTCQHLVDILMEYHEKSMVEGLTHGVP